VPARDALGVVWQGLRECARHESCPACDVNIATPGRATMPPQRPEKPSFSQKSAIRKITPPDAFRKKHGILEM
jgi:hypothetical protein